MKCAILTGTGMEEPGESDIRGVTNSIPECLCSLFYQEKKPGRIRWISRNYAQIAEEIPVRISSS